MTDQSRRLRAVLDRQFGTVVVVLLVLAALGGWVTYSAYVDPGSHVEERTDSSWEFDGEFTHSATVVNDSALFTEGETVSNRSDYFTRLMPVLDGTYGLAYAASDDGSLTVDLDVDLLLESEEDTDDGSPLWRQRSDLASNSTAEVEPGETVAVPFAVNVSEVASRSDRIQSQLGVAGDVASTVHVDVSLSGSVNGNTVEERVTHALAIGHRGGTYSVSVPGETGDSDESTRSVTVENDPGPLRSGGGPALLVLSLIGVIGLGAARRGGALTLSPAERERLAYREDRSDFDEWITVARDEVSVADDAVGVDSLAGLVDFAIDSDERVVETPDGQFFVRHDGMTYTYSPPDPDHTATDESREPEGTTPGTTAAGQTGDEDARAGGARTTAPGDTAEDLADAGVDGSGTTTDDGEATTDGGQGDY